MIHFDFDWSDFLNKLVLIGAVAILPLQLWMLFKNGKSGNTEFSGRFGLRLGLNILLWISIIAFFLKPYISTTASSKSRILTGTEVPEAFADHISDSLKAESVSIADLKKNTADTIFLIGQNFQPTILGDLLQLPNQPAIQWVPYFANDAVTNLQWRAIVRKGEMQVIHGALKSSQQQTLKLKYGNQTLDSAVLQPGNNRFKLQFPAFSQGRTTAELVLGNKTLHTLRFFARPTESLTVRFLLDNPDFETRNLANWLGKNGNAVNYEVKLSQDLQSRQNINAAKEPDLIVTDPGNASDVLIKKAVNGGKSVLFINLSNPAADIPVINRALGTRFEIRKISNEETIKISPELNALPYHFVKSSYHLGLPDYPVNAEKTKGKVAVSLLSETFPMQLTGDSVAYDKVWNAILTLLRPVSKSEIEMTAPVYKGLRGSVLFNNFGKFNHELRLGNDTIFLQKSVLNPQSASAEFLPTEAGWVTLQDSVPAEIYVGHSGAGLKTAEMADFIKSYSALKTNFQTQITGGSANLVSRKLPDWFWFAWLLFCFIALWIESKF